MNLKNYEVENATHYLQCAHCIGGNRVCYVMECTFLKEMSGRRSKVVVFGVRNWKGKDYFKKIRYVFNFKLSKITNENRRKFKRGKS